MLGQIGNRGNQRRVAYRLSPPAQFYSTSLTREAEGSDFYPEYRIFLQTIEAINSFSSQYRIGRVGARGGPATHSQQDLYRAMLVFACAGLDFLVKQLLKTKLTRLIATDSGAKLKFKEFVRRGLDKDPREIMNLAALIFTEESPRDLLLSEYIKSLTGDSLQSVEQLLKVSGASGLDQQAIFSRDRMNALKDAFIVRNQIIHEMDINVDGPRDQGYRTRRQRRATEIEEYTKDILDLGHDLFVAYKVKLGVRGGTR